MSFKFGDVIYFKSMTDSICDGGPYTVLDPPRTGPTPNSGKLRMRGPRGGYASAWWFWDQTETTVYRLEVYRDGERVK